MPVRWPGPFRSRILLLVTAASLVPAALLLGVSLYLNGLVQRQMERDRRSAEPGDQPGAGAH